MKVWKVLLFIECDYSDCANVPNYAQEIIH